MIAMPSERRTKRLERRHLDALAKRVRKILEEHFGGSPGAQTRFAKELGVSQTHISQMTRGGESDRGVGLPVLIALRAYLASKGEPTTIDALLDLDGAEAGTSADIRRLTTAVEGIVARLDERPPLKLLPPPPPSRPRSRREKDS